MSTANPLPLRQPDPERIAQAQVTKFQSWAAEHHGAPSDGGYAALHRWSVDELDTFWKAVTEWFDVRFSTPYARVLGDRSMPGAHWFPGGPSTTPSTPCGRRRPVRTNLPSCTSTRPTNRARSPGRNCAARSAP